LQAASRALAVREKSGTGAQGSCAPGSADPPFRELARARAACRGRARLDTPSQARIESRVHWPFPFPPPPDTRVQLLIAVINHPEKLDEILSGFVELGITGATILNSEGMGRVLSHDVPIFAGIAALAQHSRAQNYTIFSVIREPEKVDQVIELLREICGNLEDPAMPSPSSRISGIVPSGRRAIGRTFKTVDA
jgi:nitrogen regulatory protein P-II 1